MIFKPLTKSKPFSTPLYAYAEVFWSTIINEYFMPAPRYELAICEGYEAVNEKYLDYGTTVPMAYKEGESLLNLLEFFRKYPGAAPVWSRDIGKNDAMLMREPTITNKKRI